MSESLPQSFQPDDHLNRLLPPGLEEPWYKTFINDIRELIHPEKLPPLEVTSQPVAVKSIWGMYARDKRSNWMSLAIHAIVTVLLFTVFVSDTVQKKIKDNLIATDIAPYIPQQKPKADMMHGGGGGGDRSPTPASKGKLPKIAMKQFVPPTAVILNEHPKLAMQPTIVAPPDTVLPQVNMNQMGDPLAKLGLASNGPGSGGGIGSGSRGGVGPGSGGGYGPGSGGGTGGGAFRIGGGVSSPTLLFKIDPEYSEEARKAKYSGAVLIRLIVDPDGKPRDIKVVRSLGLGLDEKAIEAVEKWKFKPGLKNGQPVPVIATVEVNFRLL